jgi:hypothetical protein
MPRLALALTLTLSVLTSACASFAALKSETYIEPGKAFLLGGAQRGAFSVDARNSGSVPVTLFAEREGRRDSITTLRPGESATADFPAMTMAVMRNQSGTRPATVRLRVTGETSLDMRYREPVASPASASTTPPPAN